MRNVKWLKKTAAMLLAGTLMCGTAAWTGAGFAQVKAAAETPSAPSIGLKKTGSLEITKQDGNTKESLEGAGFTLYQVMSLEKDEKTGDYTYTAKEPFKAVLDNQQVKPDELGEYPAQDLERLVKDLAEVADQATAVGSEQKTDSNGVATFRDIPLGYYLVVETTAPTVEGSETTYIAGMPFLVAIPSTDNYNDPKKPGTAWVYDIKAVPKNYSTSIDKEINKEAQGTEDAPVANDGTVTVGDVVPYKITTQIPNYADELYQDATVIFKITDTMGKGLKLKVDDQDYPIEVKVGETTLTENTEYTVKTSEAEEEADLTVEFKSEYLKTETLSNKQVVITYYAEVTSDAVVGQDGNTNTPVLEYTNQPGKDADTVPGPEIKVYTFDLNVVKFTKEGEGAPKVLEGAKFELRKADPKGELVESEKITDREGKISFGKLDAGLYYLVETQAPAGYTLLTNPIKVEIIATDTNADGIADDGSFILEINDKEISQTDKDGIFVSHTNQLAGVSSIAVENHKGFTLPQTGGMGIMLFLAVGVAGIVVVSVLLTRKSKDAK